MALDKAALKTKVLADSALNALLVAGDLDAFAAALNAPVPDYWVWQTAVSRADIYHKMSPDGTSWSWVTYKAQSVPEQNAWVQMFMGDTGNFSLANFRAGVAAIFTGSAPQTAQRDHCLSCGRRLARVAEKLLASGAGTIAAPSIMTFEGAISSNDLINL